MTWRQSAGRTGRNRAASECVGSHPCDDLIALLAIASGLRPEGAASGPGAAGDGRTGRAGRCAAGQRAVARCTSSREPSPGVLGGRAAGRWRGDGGHQELEEADAHQRPPLPSGVIRQRVERSQSVGGLGRGRDDRLQAAARPFYARRGRPAGIGRRPGRSTPGGLPEPLHIHGGEYRAQRGRSRSGVPAVGAAPPGGGRVPSCPSMPPSITREALRPSA